MPCAVWSALLDHCFDAEAAYSLILVSSNDLADVELDKALQSAEEARERIQVCEQSLEHHEQMHDCFRRGAVAALSVVASSSLGRP
jgi:hypothetical protein